MPQKLSPAEDAELNRVMACLSYFGLLFLFPLVLKPDSPFAQFHARQGIGLFLLSAIYGFLVNIPIIGWFIIAPLGGLLLLVLAIIGIVNALSGRKDPLPIIGEYSKKI